MTKTLIAILSLIALNGCAWFANDEPVKPLEVITTPSTFTIYHPPLPKEIVLENVRWHVITPENLEEKILELEKFQENGFVVFAITPQAYENLAYNMQELRRYIRQQNSIILYYRSIDTKQEDTKSAPATENIQQ